MLITCPECNNQVSDKALSCPHCGFPFAMQTTLPVIRKPRKKHKKLPNKFGSIKKLSGNRKKPYAAYPATTEFHLNGSPKTMPAIGYFEDWYKAFDALTEYNKNPYDIAANDLTFKEMYDLFYDDKFNKNQKRQLSAATKSSTRAAFNNCAPLHNKKFKDLRKPDMQKVIDSCELRHASLELIQSIFKQMYRFALQNDMVEKDYSQFVTINIMDDDESGEPFSQSEIDILWNNKDDDVVKIILIMIYSGFRIKAFENMKINYTEQYFQGGVKTKAGKNRIVPFHNSITPFVNENTFSNFKSDYFRVHKFYPKLTELGIDTTSSGKKHTPHDCRHTFSWLCDKYKVNELTKHLLMGHSLGNDVERSVYGHRTTDELREAINQIQV